jgi:hypothetical protein
MSNPGPAVTTSYHPSNITTVQALRLLGVVRGVNSNAVGSTAIPLNNTNNYLPTSVVFTNANNGGATANESSTAASIYTAPGGAGGSGAEVFALTTLANLTAPLGTQIVSAYESTLAFSAQNLYVYVGTASGVVGTFDAYIYGYDFSVQQ